MLVLARKPGESLLVPAVDLIFRIMSIQGNVVRVGVQAPSDVAILREEVETDRPINSLIAALAEQRQEKHTLRNTLQGARVGVDLLDKQIELGCSPEELKETLKRIKWSFVQDGSGLSESPAPQPVTALLVEDHANERQLLTTLLKLSGCNVIEAESGEQALGYLHQAHTKPDVVLLDMGLPTMDGKEVVRKVRANPATKAIKIYVISGRDRDIEVPVDDWFMKPLNSQHLIQTLKSVRKVG